MALIAWALGPVLLTAVLSFLLIRFDTEDREARQASMTALFVTAGPSPLFIVGDRVMNSAVGYAALKKAIADARAKS